MPRLLTPQEAAALIKIKPRTLISWARKQWVPAHPLGEGRRHLWMFFEEELLAWVAARRNGGKR